MRIPCVGVVSGLVAGAGLGCALPARATTFAFDYTQGAPGAQAAGIVNDAGYIDRVTAQYDDASNRLAFSVAFGPALGGSVPATRGFWMVMSDGALPRDQANKYGIFYFDSAHPVAPHLTVYTYDGTGTHLSYLGGDLIRGAFDSSYINSLAVADTMVGGAMRRVMSFDIDASAIVGHSPAGGAGAWHGAGFGPQIGLWLYPVLWFSATYSAQGGIGSLSYFQPGWFSAEFLETQAEGGDAPAPAAGALLGLGGALAARRRRTRG